MSRSNQYAIGVIVDGTDLGIWDTFDGGDVTSEELKYNPGGMAVQVSLGGKRSVENITVGRLYELERDHNRVHWLMERVGKANVVINKQPLDVDGNVFGRPIVYSGKLQTVTPPPSDSESDDAAIITLEIGTDGSVG